jgi:DNA repair photolyase
MSTENRNDGRPLFKGRGSSRNPANRFKPIERSYFEDPADPCQSSAPETQFWQDHSRKILSANDSPDVPFDMSANPYRGCEHGCVYCYARPTHEYLDLSAGLDFETQILVKEQAAELLERELASKKWQPQVIAFSGVTDAYQPVERRLQITRRCLEVALRFKNPIAIVTKNHLVARDADLLAELAKWHCAAVYLSVTTLDNELSGKLEPRASLPMKRLEAIAQLREVGVPVGVLTAPVIPGLTEHELPQILEAAAQAGAQYAGYMVLRLPHGVKDLFAAWLQDHYPNKKNKILNRIREMRGGKLNDPKFSTRMKGEGLYAKQIRDLFYMARKKAGIPDGGPHLTTEHFQNPNDKQLELF